MRLCLSWLGEGGANLFWAWGRDLAQTPGRPSHSLQWGLWTPDIIYFIFSSIYRSRNLSIVSFYGVGCGSGKDFLNSSIGDAIFYFFLSASRAVALFSGFGGRECCTVFKLKQRLQKDKHKKPKQLGVRRRKLLKIQQSVVFESSCISDKQLSLRLEDAMVVLSAFLKYWKSHEQL